MTETESRTAQVHAKLLLRAYDREGGGFTTQDLFNRLGFCRWLADRIRLKGPEMAAWELESDHRNLQEKLFVIELGLQRLLDAHQISASSDTKIPRVRRSVQQAKSRSKD